MSDFSNDEFEKIDRFQEQDENVTSTSMTGDMAEEDRYPAASTVNEAEEMLNDFKQEYPNDSSGSGGEPLISFGSPETTVKETPVPTDSVTGKVEPCQTEGCFMKTVDPRVDDEVKGLKPSDTMEGADVPTLSEPTSAQSEACESSRGDTTTVTETVPSGNQDLHCYDNESDSLESSSEDSYSSSDADSEAESSSSEKSDDDFDKQVLIAATMEQTIPEDQQLCEVEEASKMEVAGGIKNDEENVAKSMDNIDGGEIENSDRHEILEEVSEDLALELQYSAVATAELSDEAPEDCKGFINDDIKAEAAEKSVEVAENEANGSLPTVMLGNTSGVRVTGLSAEDMTDILDKLTKDDDVGNTSPAVSDTEREIPVIQIGQEISSGDESDNDTEDSDAEESLDSDISDDLEHAEWSPSPLHSGGYSFGQDEDSEDGSDEEEIEEENDSGGIVLQGYKYKGEGEESAETENAEKLKHDVEELMAEVESLAQADPSMSVSDMAHIAFKGEAIPLKVPVLVEEEMPSDDKETEAIEIISSKEEASQLIAATSKEDHDHDLLHVTFQSPTNTIFYDPESPVIERVSIEESNELVDNEDETKDVDQKMDESSSEDRNAALEAKVVQDLKEVYDNLEARAEIEGALELLKESGLKNVDELAHTMTQDVLRRNKLSAANPVSVETEESEVVFRKNSKNVTDFDEAEVDEDRGSMIVHENPAMEYHDVVLRQKEDSEGVAAEREAVSSMVIYDVENENLDAVCMKNDEEYEAESTTGSEKDSMNYVGIRQEVDSTKEPLVEPEIMESVELGVNTSNHNASVEDSLNISSESEGLFNSSLNETVVEAKCGACVEQKADQMVQELLSEVLNSNEILVNKPKEDIHDIEEVTVDSQKDQEMETIEILEDNVQAEKIIENENICLVSKESEQNIDKDIEKESEPQIEVVADQSAIAGNTVSVNESSKKLDLSVDEVIDNDNTAVESKFDLQEDNLQEQEESQNFVELQKPETGDELPELIEVDQQIEETTSSKEKAIEASIVEDREVCDEEEKVINTDEVKLSIVSDNVVPDYKALVNTALEENASEKLEPNLTKYGISDVGQQVEQGMVDNGTVVPIPCITVDVIPDIEPEKDEAVDRESQLKLEAEKEVVAEEEIQAQEEVNEELAATPSLAARVVQEVIQEVLELIYWRDVKKTGVVFGSMLFVLLSLACFSLLSVLAYLSLAILTVTFSFRVYKNVMQAVQKTNDGHPFKKLMELDLELKEDVVKNAAEKLAANINNCSRELRRLYLVGDYVDSLKFGLLLWLLTYVGSWFNGMTLVILAVISIFTVPKVYETYQGPIDQNINLVRAQLNKIMAQVSEKIPFPKKKAKAQ